MSTTGFVGLGNMGLPMSQRLLDGGVALVVHDVRAAPLQSLLAHVASKGSSVAGGASARDVADRCSVVFTSLPTLASVESVVLSEDGLINGRALRTVVNTSTVGQPLTERLAAALSARGIALIDCPVSGGPDGARAGTLSVMVSGDPQIIETLQPLLQRFGVVTNAGPKPGLAQLLKLTNNILSAVAVVATSEAFVMGAKGGLDPEVMLAAINAGSGRNSMTLHKIPTCVLDRSFGFGATVDVLMKDIELAIECGEALGVPMWVCQTARLFFKHATYAGMGQRDVTELIKVVEAGAGFELPKTR